MAKDKDDWDINPNIDIDDFDISEVEDITDDGESAWDE